MTAPANHPPAEPASALGPHTEASRTRLEGRKRDGRQKAGRVRYSQDGEFWITVRRCHEQRVAPGGMVFHVLNRGVARMQLFEKAADYQAFEQVLQDTLDQSPMRICAYAVMPNHWHLLCGRSAMASYPACMQRLTITHVRRWQEHRGYAGLGHVYQGRYKSFPGWGERRAFLGCGPIRRAPNALAPQSRLASGGMAVVKLVATLSSYGSRAVVVGGVADRYASELARAGNQTQTAQELEALRRSVQRGRPFSASRNGRRKSRNVWAYESAYRPTGRPRRVGRNRSASPG